MSSEAPKQRASLAVPLAVGDRAGLVAAVWVTYPDNSSTEDRWSGAPLAPMKVPQSAGGPRRRTWSCRRAALSRRLASPPRLLRRGVRHFRTRAPSAPPSWPRQDTVQRAGATGTTTLRFDSKEAIYG